jgi:hypothetical protein
MHQESKNRQETEEDRGQNTETIFEEESVMENTSIEVTEAETNPATVNAENGEYQEVKKWVDESLTESLADATELFEDLSKSNDIEKTLAATKQAIRESNKMVSFGAGVAAGYAAQGGNLLRLLKDQVKANGENWDDYANKNLPGLSLRTIQKYIRISKIPGVEGHLVLGIERLYLLGPVVEGIESDDPISVFLSKHTLEFDPTVEMDFEGFKRRINEITIQEKAASKDMRIAPETAAKMVERGVHLTAEVLDQARVIKESGGQLEIYLGNLADNAKKPSPNSSKSTKKVQSKLKSFNKLAEEFKDLIKEAKTTAKDNLKNIDLKSLDELLAELEALKAHLAKQ